MGVLGQPVAVLRRAGAPQDPLLNQYYLAFQSAREETLRALAVSLPNTRPLGRY